MEFQLTIEGMHCGHCVASVRKVLDRLGLDPIDVAVGRARVDSAEAPEEAPLGNALAEAGFKLLRVEPSAG